jgi:hypothetical protein
MIGQEAIRGGWCGTRRGEGEDDRRPDSIRQNQKQIMGRTKKKKLPKKRESTYPDSKV